MRVLFQIALLILYITASESSIYSNVADTLSRYVKSSLRTLKASLVKEDPDANVQNQENIQRYGLSSETPISDFIISGPRPYTGQYKTKGNGKNKGKNKHKGKNKNKGKNIKKGIGKNKNKGKSKPNKNKNSKIGYQPYSGEPKIEIERRPINANNKDSPNTIIRIFKSSDGEFRAKEDRFRNVEFVNAPENTVILSSNESREDLTEKKPYHLDGVLSTIRRTQNIARRAASSSDDSDSESSSLEMREWKKEWKELWLKKKLEALNQTLPQGDVVNMVAARPWGVPCGDPNQHDMPWGTCMLPMECEAEYRIYRGDFSCGRTKFVCCSLQLTNYDMYQGMDISFAGSGLSTDSEEQRNRGKGSSEKRRKRKEKEKKRRRKARQKRKKKIKKNIKKIIREIRKILNKQYKNGTKQRKRKTKQLKKFIKDLKKKYRKDRKSVKNVHEIELVKIDMKLLNKIKQIRDLNQNFVNNATFRDIVVNGTINKQGARMLVEAYPELIPYFIDSTRRSGDGGQETPDYKDYDVEYGMLYY